MPARLVRGLGPACVLALLLHPLPVSWLGLAGLASLAIARWRRSGRPWPASAFELPLLLLALGGLVGLVVSFDRPNAELRFSGLLAALAGFWLVLDRVTTGSVARQTTRTLLGGAVLGLLLVLVLTSPSLRAERMPGPLVEPVQAVARLGAALSLADLADAIGGERYRLGPSGPAALAAYGLALALGPLLVSRDRRGRLLGGLAGGWCVLGLVLAGSRGSLAAAAIASLLLASLWNRWLLIGALAAGVLLFSILTGLLLPNLLWTARDELSFVPDAAFDFGPLYVRQEFWGNLLYLLADFRYTGVGLSGHSVQRIYSLVYLPLDVDFSHAHNAFLQAYLELGLLGLIGLLGLLFVGTRLGVGALATVREPAAREALFSASGAGLALLLSGLTDNVALTSIGLVLLLLALGLLEAAARSSRNPLAAGRAARPASVFRRLSRALGPIGLVLAAAVTIVAVAGRSQLSAPPIRGPAELARTLQASLLLNLGAVEVAKGIVEADDLPPDTVREHLEAGRPWLMAAQAQEPANPAPYLHLAAYYIARQRPNTAREMLEQASALAAPGDDRFYFQLGRLYRDVGDVDRAIAAWQRVDRRLGAWSCAGPDLQLVHWGQELNELGLWSKAVEVNLAAIERLPAERASYLALGEAYDEWDRPNTGLRTLLALAERFPDVPWPREAAARLYDDLDQPDEASRQRARAAEIASSAEWRAERARARPLRDCSAEALGIRQDQPRGERPPAVRARRADR